MNDIDWAAMADLLEDEGEVHRPYVRQAIDELSDLRPRRVLDIGSGPGVAACQLAETYPRAEVVAVDGAPELLARAEDRAKHLGQHLRTTVAEFPADLGRLETADLIWSANTMHHVGDQQTALEQLSTLLAPGGVLALTEGGLPSRWLPRDLGFGRPGLHFRLDDAMNERFTAMRAELPGSASTVEDWPSMLRRAGLVDARSRTFLVDLPAPLDEAPRRCVRHWMQRYRSALAEDVDATDLATLDRLLDPADPDGVDQREDLFFRTAKTVHYARRPQQ
ncbi:methyltransferase domain-containing protein [Allosaccharopolyspora coralli]|uniref:Methyltransferase domain-containing protein n=1 Tax=Allosaccharopolyspora coralli TaxID=2665642 RepID=A0A5Q3Q9L0_9PSEU|nr:class I SAM-dependent methyltransferase [Allosaccharopolyspora coralli]QGK71053.1 methyltransferase domain-containing protein [Allosaccharopolyspora coralli]